MTFRIDRVDDGTTPDGAEWKYRMTFGGAAIWAISAAVIVALLGNTRHPERYLNADADAQLKARTRFLREAFDEFKSSTPISDDAAHEILQQMDATEFEVWVYGNRMTAEAIGLPDNTWRFQVALPVCATDYEPHTDLPLPKGADNTYSPQNLPPKDYKWDGRDVMVLDPSEDLTLLQTLVEMAPLFGAPVELAQAGSLDILSEHIPTGNAEMNREIWLDANDFGLSNRFVARLGRDDREVLQIGDVVTVINEDIDAPFECVVLERWDESALFERVSERSGQQPPASTAMGLVDMAHKGQLDHDTLMYWLLRWNYEPQYHVTSVVDDGIRVPNSWGAVNMAHFYVLISDDEYEQIFQSAHMRGIPLQ